MQTNKNATQQTLRILSLFLAAIVIVCGVLFFTIDSWIPITVMYGCVSIAALLSVLDRIWKDNKAFIDKLTIGIYAVLSLMFCANMIAALIRNL